MKLFRVLVALALLLYPDVTFSQQISLRESCEINASLPRPERRVDTVAVRFIGDVMMHSAQIEAADKGGGTFDFSSFLSGIEDDLCSADLSVANMEFTFGGEPYTGYPAFSAPDSFAGYVLYCGVDVLLAANNHILDRGVPGLKRTIKMYDSLETRFPNVRYTGIAKAGDSTRYPIIVNAKGVRIAIVNFTYGTNMDGEIDDEEMVFRQDSAKVCAAIDTAKASGADCIVACPHWGIEYELEHSHTQAKWARMLAEKGVDVIIGAHPHVVQDMEVIETRDGRKVSVYYSLGNAVSNMSAVNTQLELMVTLRFLNDELGNNSFMDISHEWLWCTRPGSLTDNYKVIKVSEYLGHRGRWINPADYDKMEETLRRIETPVTRR